MFGALFFDRDPLQLHDLGPGFLSWLQDAGGFAAAGLVLWLVFGLSRWRTEQRAAVPGWQSGVFSGAILGAALSYLVYFALFPFVATSEPSTSAPVAGQQSSGGLAGAQGLFLALGGACAIVAVGLPFGRNLARVRFRRIFALAKLSFKEAVRRRALYACSALLLVFLFGSWFIDTKPSDQVRTYVQVVFWSMTFLLLFTSVLLAAFSIPNDIKQQTIHTIVTKPVERFEVLMGRFLGFLSLMSLVLLLMTAVSLLYILRGVKQEAAEESLKARIPLYGELEFENTGDKKKGTDVGRERPSEREWDFRSYITGSKPGLPPQMARWDFRTLPGRLAQRDRVRIEFSFDVYRTTKGKENKGVPCSFYFRTWRYEDGNDKAFRDEREVLRKQGKTEAEIEGPLSEKYGYYEPRGAVEVTDFKIQSLDVPGALFRNAVTDQPPSGKPRLQLRVRCTSPTQYVGMAKYDLYAREDEPGGSERLEFAWNFFKTSFGLWLRLALMIGLAVALSTYLSGVITMLVTLVFYVGGLCQEFIRSVAFGKNPGGGPLEAMTRLAKGELTGPSGEDDPSAGARLILASDNSFRWMVRRILNVIPDVDRFDLTPFLAEGFAISGTQMLLNLLLLVGYLLPWAVLAFYLIRWREVASPN